MKLFYSKAVDRDDVPIEVLLTTTMFMITDDTLEMIIPGHGVLRFERRKGEVAEREYWEARRKELAAE